LRPPHRSPPALPHVEHLHPDCRLAVLDEISIRHLIRPSFRHASKERFEAGPAHLPKLNQAVFRSAAAAAPTRRAISSGSLPHLGLGGAPEGSPGAICVASCELLRPCLAPASHIQTSRTGVVSKASRHSLKGVPVSLAVPPAGPSRARSTGPNCQRAISRTTRPPVEIRLLPKQMHFVCSIASPLWATRSDFSLGTNRFVYLCIQHSISSPLWVACARHYTTSPLRVTGHLLRSVYQYPRY
jgi:hypothetical protein